jgi:hypothetical protein
VPSVEASSGDDQFYVRRRRAGLPSPYALRQSFGVARSRYRHTRSAPRRARGQLAKSAPPTFAFGRAGGNIVPFRITIGKDGRVSSTGPIRATAPAASVALRNGLARLAKAEGFFAMAADIPCGPTNPDIAGRFVTVTAYGKTRTVFARCASFQAFEELYAVLAASTGVTL